MRRPQTDLNSSGAHNPPTTASNPLCTLQRAGTLGVEMVGAPRSPTVQAAPSSTIYQVALSRSPSTGYKSAKMSLDCVRKRHEEEEVKLSTPEIIWWITIPPTKVEYVGNGTTTCAQKRTDLAGFWTESSSVQWEML